MVGQVVGRYRILARLGEGGMGTVWKAQHTLLPDRLAALKLLSESLWESEEARQRFLREAIAVSKLDHPRIASLYDAEHIDGRLCIAFKFIDGDTVARKTEAGPLPLGEAVAIAADAASALAHAHARGVLHRDVSAGNIMIDREGHGVLVDFGLARSGVETQLTRTGTTLGTLAYMAPEVLRGGVADARSDLYGLGAVLYRMVTGRPLFAADSAEALQYKVLNEVPQAPSELRPDTPPALDDLILRLLEKRSGDRYVSAEAVLEQLERVGKLPAIGAERTEPMVVPWWVRWPRRWRRAMRRRSARWALAAGGVLLLATIAAGIAWQRGWRPGFMAPHVPVLAVLPARNASADAEETAYLAEGLGEEIVTRLNQLAGVRVLPWLTTRRYTDSSKPFKAIARELGAEALLVTSYQGDEERLRVTASLVDGRDGTQRWSQAYEENADDLFAIQRDVAVGVALRLKRQLSDEERGHLAKSPSQNPEAYAFFIRGANYLQADDPESKAMARSFFEKALALDPNLAEAWVGMGASNLERAYTGEWGDSTLRAQARGYFRRALEIDPGLMSAARGLIRVSDEVESLEIGKAVRRRGPDDVEALLVQAWAYALGGLPGKALPILDRILELDPANQAAALYRIYAASWSGPQERTVEYATAYLQRFGEDGEAYVGLGASWVCLGKLKQAQLCYERAMELMGDERSTVDVISGALEVYGRLGERQKQEALAAKWVKLMEQRLATGSHTRAHANMLVGLNATLGRKQVVERLVSEMLRDHREPDFFGWANALSQVGDRRRALEMLQAARRDDLAGYYWLLAGCESGVDPRLFAEPEFKSFLAAVRVRVNQLAAKY